MTVLSSRLFGVYATALLIMLPGLAHAGAVNVCISYDLDFDDADIAVGDDFMKDNGTAPARGIRVHLEGPSSTVVAYAETTGPNVGCASFSTAYGTTYTVRVLSQHRVGPHEVSVRDSSSNLHWDHVADPLLAGTLAPYSSVSYTLPANRNWNVAAATGHALWRADGNQVVDADYFTAEANGTLHSPSYCSGGCVDGTDVYIPTAQANRKYAVAYTMGWVILNTMGAPAIVDSLDTQYCSQGTGVLELGSIEYHGAAAAAGFAHLYAAWAFNRLKTEDNCSYVYWRDANWDQLGYPCYEELESESGHVLSCTTGPALAPLPELVPPTDYKAHCEHWSPGVTAPFPADTSVPLDWLRFWRDLLRSTSGTMDDIGEIYEDSVPDAWVITPYAYERLRSAANTNGLNNTTWDDAASEHGIRD